MLRKSSRLLANKAVHFLSVGLTCFWLPFLIVTGHWQRVLRSFSGLRFTCLGMGWRLIPLILLAVAAAAVYWFRRKLTGRRAVAVGVMFAMLYLSWCIADIYMALSFFDVQANYHYAAYALMTVLFFRAFGRDDRPAWLLMYLAFAVCLSISLADEGAQRFASHRVFDLNDNAKDALGIIFGIIVVFFLWQPTGTIRFRTIPKGACNPLHYLKHPACALVLLGVLTYVLLIMSALFSSPQYWYVVVLGTVFLFLIALVLLYATRFRWGRRILAGVLAVLVIGQATSLALHWNSGIMFHNTWLTVYRGVPVPFCDVLIYPNGAMRPVDKKHIRLLEVRGFFTRYNPSILVVGSEHWTPPDGRLDVMPGTHMVWNERAGRHMQISVVDPDTARRLYNRYRQEGRNVMCVLHTRCGTLFE